MLQNIYSNAELVRNVARTDLGIAVNYDEMGVRWLDSYIENQRISGAPEVLERLPNTLGSFLGECVRYSFGGEWVKDSENGAWTVRVNDNLSVFPFNKVRKQLQGGEGDSVLGLFIAIKPFLNGLTDIPSKPNSQIQKRPWWKIWMN